MPAKIDTVLLPLGTLEPHGVMANGADILAPVAIAREIGPKVNATIAPVVAYGFTGSMDAYPGTFTVPEDVYRPYVRSVLLGLAKNRFKAKTYFARVNEKLARLVQDIIRKWNLAGVED